MANRHFRLELYGMHAHIDGGKVDYSNLFNAILPLLASYQGREGIKRVEIGRAELLGDGRLFIVAYTGYSARSTLFYDSVAREEQPQVNDPRRFQARKTHFMIDPGKRLLAADVKKGNLSPTELALLIENLARSQDQYRTLDLNFAPVADGEFVKEIESLTRIQSATVTITRPNIDWSDWNAEMSSVADESNAGAMDVTVRARRDKTLAKNTGLVQFVKEFAVRASPIFKGVRIIGSRAQDSGLTTLNLSKHVEHQTISVPEDASTAQPSEDAVQKSMGQFLSTRS